MSCALTPTPTLRYTKLACYCLVVPSKLHYLREVSMEKREYTSKEAAEYIGCKPVTIRQNVLRGKLKPLRKVGFLWVFSSSQIEKFKSHYSPKK